jgi:hypothetical protein
MDEEADFENDRIERLRDELHDLRGQLHDTEVGEREPIRERISKVKDEIEDELSSGDDHE